jgi:hypothetical protein
MDQRGDDLAPQFASTGISVRVGEGVLYGSRLSLVAPPICNAHPSVSRIARSYRSLCRSWVVACEDTLTSLYRVVSTREVRARSPALILRSRSHEKPAPTDRRDDFDHKELTASDQLQVSSSIERGQSCLSRRERARSARSLPSVWQRGQ